MNLLLTLWFIFEPNPCIDPMIMFECDSSELRSYIYYKDPTICMQPKWESRMNWSDKKLNAKRCKKLIEEF